MFILPAHAFEVEGLRFGAKGDGTRLVLDLDETKNFRVFSLSNPYRIVIDLPKFNWQMSGFAPRPRASVKALRHGALTPFVSRVVLDMDKPVQISSAFMLKNPSRLVIDYKAVQPMVYNRIKKNTFGKLDVNLSGPASAVVQTNPQITTTRSGAPVQEVLTGVESVQASASYISANGYPIPQRKPVALAEQARILYAENPPDYTPAQPVRSARKPLIVIDAGHGGVDPGAIGAGGKHEKHAVLALAKELRTQLLKSGKYRILMTRERDVFIKLGDRRKLAHDRGADLFVSIHADSVERGDARGASFYTLSNKASDAQTAKLAAKENRADLIAGVDLRHEDDEVSEILLDLVMRDTMNQSRFFAGSLVKAFQSSGLKTLQRPHRYAGFAVLKSPDVPSVLIEAGFMSNRKEEKLLHTSSYRKKLATAIKNGVDTYFAQVEKNGL